MDNKIYGYAGKALWVNLTDGLIEERELDPTQLRKYIGGVGYSADILYHSLPANLDPMSEKNMLIFSTGPLSLNTVPGGGSVMICFKSPATRIWGQSRCGGNFGPDMKRAGYDFIVISGRSPKPVYLEVVQGKAYIRDGEHLVGKSVLEKTDLIENHVKGGDHKHTSSMVIGIGGENRLKLASIMCRHRAAGRGGGGAVMGSKNLLGVVVSGNMQVDIAQPDQYRGLIKSMNKKIMENDARTGLHEFGTIGDLAYCDEGGDLPTKNWRSNSFGDCTQIHDEYYEQIFVKSAGCYKGCPVACGRVVQVKEGDYKTPVHEGCEYETMAAFTAFIMNRDPKLSAYCGYLCNEYGMDTISTGAMIAFAMECYEKGLITDEESDGVPLTWGDAKAILHTLDMIVHRKHIGDILAEGVREAARRIGKGSEAFAVHVKGLEGPAHDPRCGKMLGITYGTANRGMCHVQPFEGSGFDKGKMHWNMLKYGVCDPETMDRWDETGKGKECKILQDGMSAPDIITTCKLLMYTGVTLVDWADMVAALTGWDFDDYELLEVCERVNNLQRIFNVREGITRADDKLPERVLTIPEFGAYAEEKCCVIHDYESLLDEYYAARGWDIATGKPTEEKLRQLKLEE